MSIVGGGRLITDCVEELSGSGRPSVPARVLRTAPQSAPWDMIDLSVPAVARQVVYCLALNQLLCPVYPRQPAEPSSSGTGDEFAKGKWFCCDNDDHKIASLVMHVSDPWQF